MGASIFVVLIAVVISIYTIISIPIDFRGLAEYIHEKFTENITPKVSEFIDGIFNISTWLDELFHPRK